MKWKTNKRKADRLIMLNLDTERFQSPTILKTIFLYELFPQSLKRLIMIYVQHRLRHFSRNGNYKQQIFSRDREADLN